MADDNLHSSDDDLLANAIDISQMQDDSEPEAIEIELDDSGDQTPSRTIRTFGDVKKAEAQWKRQPNQTGQGATHIRTFVAKLRLDAIENLDQQINDWLDEHPELEVKFCTVSHGMLTGKNKEEAMFMSVWV